MTLSLEQPMRVTLVLYDLAGREVKRILDRTLLSAGLQRIPIDLRGRRGGLYFLEATVGARPETRKLVLLP